MPERRSRQSHLRRHPSARAWAALDRAANNRLMNVSYDPCLPVKNSLNGKHVVVLGSGVGGLTTAYELLSRNDDIHVTVLEARDRTGGRCLTLRTGDTFTEDKNNDLWSRPGESQTVRFNRPRGDSEPYLNAGPGRIPSGHKLLLGYLQRFDVQVEVYVMDSESNMTQMENGPDGKAPVVNRRLGHNTRGWVAEMVYQNAAPLLESALGEDVTEGDVERLQSLMVTFGDLTPEGKYVVGVSEEGEDDNEWASDRAGFLVLPGVLPGKIALAFSLKQLLDSEYWEETSFYQPADFLWQPTLFQPVGGMDQVQHAFAQKVAALGGDIYLNCPVTKIEYKNKKFVIRAKGHDQPFEADYCFCNIAMPFLERILDEELQQPKSDKGFSPEFKDALHAVYKAQKNRDATRRFLACTTKVGWQADRCLWQGKPFEEIESDGSIQLKPDGSEVGVVPIYGGISWTDNPITQIWYPSNAFHDQRGVLTGTYNFSKDAFEAGKMPIQKRLDEARCGAALFGKEFAEGLEKGVAIAWQNMGYIKGGWAQWHNVDDSVCHFNEIIQGTGVNGEEKPSFFIVGDQVSSLPGWQEGAIAAALNAITRLVRPDRRLPHLKALPDTRIMVEGL